MSQPLTIAEKIALLAVLRRAAKKGLLKSDKPVWLMGVIEGGKY